MDKKALQLACRFSLPPNSLGYCGQNTAPEKFKKCVIDSLCNGIKKELEKIPDPEARLSTISGIGELSINFN